MALASEERIEVAAQVGQFAPDRADVAGRFGERPREYVELGVAVHFEFIELGAIAVLSRSLSQQRRRIDTGIRPRQRLATERLRFVLRGEFVRHVVETAKAELQLVHHRRELCHPLLERRAVHHEFADQLDHVVQLGDRNPHGLTRRERCLGSRFTGGGRSTRHEAAQRMRRGSSSVDVDEGGLE